LPSEFQHKLETLHTEGIEDEKSRNRAKNDLYEMFGFGRKRKHVKVVDLKKKELKRKFEERYKGIEWSLDGRRVVDDDYDDLEPAYERKLHKERLTRDKLNEDEMDMLLDEDL
jgi:hypothetical protein